MCYPQETHVRYRRRKMPGYLMEAWVRFNIKNLFWAYDSHYNDKVVVRPSYLNDRNLYTYNDKMASLYRDALDDVYVLW